MTCRRPVQPCESLTDKFGLSWQVFRPLWGAAFRDEIPPNDDARPAVAVADGAGDAVAPGVVAGIVGVGEGEALGDAELPLN